MTVPGGAPVHYCSWASHHLPDVWRRARGVPARALRRRATRERSRRAPTSRSAAARARASGCASARPRSARSPPRSSSASASSSRPGYRLRIRHVADDRRREHGLPMVPRRAAGPRTAARARPSRRRLALLRPTWTFSTPRAVARELKLPSHWATNGSSPWAAPARREVAVRGDLDGLVRQRLEPPAGS